MRILWFGCFQRNIYAYIFPFYRSSLSSHHSHIVTQRFSRHVRCWYRVGLAVLTAVDIYSIIVFVYYIHSIWILNICQSTVQRIKWINKSFYKYRSEPNVYYWIFEYVRLHIFLPMQSHCEQKSSSDSRTFLWHPISFNQLAIPYAQKPIYARQDVLPNIRSFGILKSIWMDNAFSYIKLMVGNQFNVFVRINSSSL